MITNFEEFLNENESDDIKKRLLQRIDNAFKKIRIENKIPEPIKNEPIKINSVTNQLKEPILKSKKSKFGDYRLDDAYFGLIGMQYTDKAIKDYLGDIILEPNDTADSIIYWGIKKYLGVK